jgi:hypothetical protein
MRFIEAVDYKRRFLSLSLQVAKGHHAIRGNSDANSGNFFPREANENARE